MVKENLSRATFFENMMECLSAWRNYAEMSEHEEEQKEFLFVSFDLSGSTAFKTEHPKLWPYVVPEFYQEIRSKFGIESYDRFEKDCCAQISDIGSWKVWKLLGDEVLLYMEINDIENLYPWITEIYGIQRSLLDGVAMRVVSRIFATAQTFREANHLGADFGKNIGLLREILKTKLGVKATVWLAGCGNDPAKKMANLYFNTHMSGVSAEQWDFLGRDIDEGFRVAKETPRNALVVTPLVAWLIYRHGSEENRLGIGHETLPCQSFRTIAALNLKGVWEDRAVPIIIYNPKFNRQEWQLEQLKRATKDVAFLDEIVDEGDELDENTAYPLSRLDELFREIGRKKEYEDLYESLVNE